MAEPQDGPPLIRPIPRRPFTLNARSPTPPEQDDDQVPSRLPTNNSGLNLEFLNSRLLSVHNSHQTGPSDSGSISRDESFRNLTSSTLMGIYEPTGTSIKDDSTPWGTGAETPARDLSQDEPYYLTQKERARHPRRRSSVYSSATSAPPPPLSSSTYLFHFGLRSLLLGTLGAIYGFLVAQVPGGPRWTALYVDGIIMSHDYDWKYLSIWALVGVGLGSLLPWFDEVWKSPRSEDNEQSVVDEDSQEPDQEPESGADWTMAIRGVGAFVGIAFAIRKVPWDSALQASVTLALVNPMLWFLIDRSTPGFVLSAAVGLAGSIILTGLQPEMGFVPADSLMRLGTLSQRNATVIRTDDELLGGVMHRQTMEMGIWALSVLFCCCVCFGNVGRRLALTRSSISKGFNAS